MAATGVVSQECDQEIEAGIRTFEASSEPPSAGADDPQDEGTGDDEPEPPTESAAKRFDLRSHLTRLFGTDLTLIPGIGASTALVLFTELGPDLSRFPSAAQFASWLNLCPQNKITGGKVISSQTGPGSNRAAQALRWATQSLYRSQSPWPSTFAACGRTWVLPRRPRRPRTNWRGSSTI